MKIAARTRSVVGLAAGESVPILMRRNFGASKSLYFGWRSLGIDYDDSDFEMNVDIYGPIIGFRFSF